LKERLEFRVKGTLILRRRGRFFKVITTRNTGGNWWTFECMDIESKQNRVFKYEMLGMLEALDKAASKLKDPKDILLIDLDNRGKWVIMTKDQINNAVKSRK
jgi:hypothetical protein